MNRTHLTILEQLRITEIEIAHRKELVNFTNEDAELLLKCKVIINDKLQAIADEFYEQQIKVDEIALLIGDQDTLNKLRKAQTQYIRDLFSGFYDLEYVNNRLRIGIVHKRIGVEPKLYLSAVLNLKNLIIKYIKPHISDEVRFTKIQQALDKLFHFDVTFVFDTYIRSLITEIKLSKKLEEEYSRSLEEKVAERTKQLEELSRRDMLTGLFNMRSFYEFLRRDLLYAQRYKLPLSLVYFDVDKFKNINDTFGHKKGDEILEIIGFCLLEIVRETDTPCRYGGDEFCVILQNCTDEDAEKFCHRLVELFKRKTQHISLSIGIKQIDANNTMNYDELVIAADNNMYEAKKQEGFCIVK